MDKRAIKKLRIPKILSFKRLSARSLMRSVTLCTQNRIGPFILNTAAGRSLNFFPCCHLLAHSLSLTGHLLLLGFDRVHKIIDSGKLPGECIFAVTG